MHVLEMKHWQDAAVVLYGALPIEERTEEAIFDLFCKHTGLVPADGLVEPYLALRRLLLPYVAA